MAKKLSKARLRLIDTGMCLSDHGAKAYSRGLCQRCLEWARNAIARGEYTEQQLIDLGHMLPPKRKGRKAQNALAKALGKST